LTPRRRIGNNVIVPIGAHFYLPPKIASTVYLTGLGESTTTGVILDGRRIDLPLGERVALSVSFDLELSLVNLGPDPVELTWSPDARDPRDDPAYDAQARRAMLADPWRDLITEAWSKSFDTSAANPFCLPRELGRYDPSTLSDVTGIELGRGFTTMCPGWSEGTAWGNGNAKADLRGLVLRQLRTAQYTVPPIFSPGDRTVTLQFRLPTFQLDGICHLHQQCSHGVFGWTWYTTDQSVWDAFALYLDDTLLTFNAVTVDDPVLGIRVDVTDTRVDIRGARRLEFPALQSLPEWLRWLINGWLQVQEFRVATEIAAVHALRQPDIRRVLQAVVNNWITALGRTATVSGRTDG